MEPISTVASTVAAMLFGEAVKEVGKGLGKTVITLLSILSKRRKPKGFEPSQ